MKLLPSRFGIDDIEQAPFAIAVLDRVEDLQDTAVERICKQLAGMAAPSLPF